MKSTNQIEPRHGKQDPRLKRALLYQLSYAPTLQQGNTPTPADVSAENHNISTQAMPGCGISPVARREQTPLEHAIGVASSKQVYMLDGQPVYLSSRKRMRHINKSWGYYTLAIYRGVLEGFERTMPLGRFFASAKATGKKVEDWQ